MQLLQPPDSAHLLQPFSYTAAKLSRCFQLRVPRKAAQQPEGPGSGTTADGGHRGAKSRPSLPSELCVCVSWEWEAGGGSHFVPCSPSSPHTSPGDMKDSTDLPACTCPCCRPGHRHPVLLIWDDWMRKSPKSLPLELSPQGDQACSSPPQVGKTPTTAIASALAKGTCCLHSTRPQPGPQSSVRA